MDAYDWDKTIFRRDTTGRFFLFCLKRYPETRRFMGVALRVALRHLSGKPPVPEMKRRFYGYYGCVPDMQAAVREFWRENAGLIGSPAMPCNPQPGDAVVSASAEFLLEEVCAERGLILLGTKLDPATGEPLGPDCYGEEKVRRFREHFGDDAAIGTWYSDSTSDAPMARLAGRAFIVKPGRLIPWPES